MKAINLAFHETRLNEVARDLYLEHGWQLPDRFKDKRNRDPLAFALAEWQQAKRAKQDASSDSVVAAYEKRIVKLEREKLILSERADKMRPPEGRPEEFIEHSLEFLSSHCNIY